MLANYAFSFVQMVRQVENTQYNLGWEKTENQKGYFEDASRISGVRLALQSVKEFCAIVGIDLSNQVRRASEILDTQSTDQFDRLAGAFEEITNRIEDELQLRMFIFIPGDRTGYCDKPELFGPDVAAKFPEANKEIRQAGNCYAIGSYTACVFHLMRAVEVGARCMVTKLKVQKHLMRNGKRIPVELCDWGTLIAALDKGVLALAQGTATSTRKKDNFEFYNHAVGAFRNFKDAWRNNVAHMRKQYKPGETKDIMNNTRQFMRHLATRIKE